jgi:hypothetical protein
MKAKKIQCPHCECGIYVAGGDTVVGFEPPTVEPCKGNEPEYSISEDWVKERILGLKEDNQPQEGKDDQGGQHGKEE